MITDRNLTPGDTLKATHKKAVYLAEIITFQDEKNLTVEITEGDTALVGSRYNSLSRAAIAITGNSVNGWRFWTLMNDGPLTPGLGDDRETHIDRRPAEKAAKARIDGRAAEFDKAVADFAGELETPEGKAALARALGAEPEAPKRLKRPGKANVADAIDIPASGAPDSVILEGQRHTIDAKRGPEKATAAATAIHKACGDLEPLPPSESYAVKASGPSIADTLKRSAAFTRRNGTYNPIKRNANQKGLEAGQTRYFCDGCQASFIGDDETYDPKADKSMCGNGHNVAVMRAAATNAAPAVERYTGPTIDCSDEPAEQPMPGVDDVDAWTGEENIDRA